MKIETGYIYHVKDSFFDLINDTKLMVNHENGKSRPTYFTIKDGNILWFIPLSSKVGKYKNIIKDKVQKYGNCRTIMIRKIANKEVAILLQNAFPTTTEFIDHPHIVNGKPLRVISSLEREILVNFRYMMSLKKRGINLFFADVDSIEAILKNRIFLEE